MEPNGEQPRDIGYTVSTEADRDPVLEGQPELHAVALEIGPELTSELQAQRDEVVQAFKTLGLTTESIAQYSAYMGALESYVDSDLSCNSRFWVMVQDALLLHAAERSDKCRDVLDELLDLGAHADGLSEPVLQRLQAVRDSL